jgi:hypothetical protein
MLNFTDTSVLVSHKFDVKFTLRFTKYVGMLFKNDVYWVNVTSCEQIIDYR